MSSNPSSPPLVIVSLPGRTAEALRLQLALASRGGADLVEIRLDRLAPGEFKRLERVHDLPLTHPWIPALGTLRSRAEGGEGPDDPTERARILRQALELFPFSYLDLEIARDEPLRDSFRQDEGRPLGLVGSAHLPAGEVDRALDLLPQALEGYDLAKIVCRASATEILAKVLPTLEGFRDRPYIFHTLGGAGSLLRVLSRRLGMEWTFASLPETAPGTGSSSRVEPSQIPSDHLRRYLVGDANAPWYAIVGRPLGHTLSPFYQNVFLEATETRGLYVGWEPEEGEDVGGVLRKLTAFGLAGVNVTRPFKQTLLPLVTEADAEVQESGAVNTLVFPSPGAVRGYNTDVLALEKRLREGKEQGLWDGSEALVVGTGGSARAALTAARRLGAKLFVHGRNPEHAAALVREGPGAGGTSRRTGELRPFPLLIHCTPVGQSEPLGTPPALGAALAPGSWVLDLVYRPRIPWLAELAHRVGARYEDGTRILLYQARESFEHFTGRELADASFEALLPEAGA